ncbi:MAG: hypothetical protein AMXMBFR7_13890 [Planctomycetota bacterium]
MTFRWRGAWGLVLLAAACAHGGEPEAADAYGAKVAEGRALFGKRQFAAALEQFRGAIGLKPEAVPARLFAGVSAYWAGEAEESLSYFDGLLKQVPPGSKEEWQVQVQRVAVCHQLDQAEEAIQAIKRMYALRGPEGPKEAREAQGFTREHVYLEEFRVGVWEVFDEHGEKDKLWTFVMVNPHGAEEKVVRTLDVRLQARAGGGPAYVLTEGEGAQQVAHARWDRKPAYPEVRKKALEVLAAKPEPAAAPNTAEVPAAPDEEPEAGQRAYTPAEKGRLAKAVALGLERGATRILQLSACLAEVDYDLTKAVRLSLTDPKAARTYEKDELLTKHPHARSEAALLVQAVARAKPEDLDAALEHAGKVIGEAKGAYVQFVLLTAVNTRGGKLPKPFVAACAESDDFMVRRTAALMLGRGGDRLGLKALFDEVAKADPVGLQLLGYALDELLGEALTPCPGEAEGAAKWRAETLRWWAKHSERIVYAGGAGVPWILPPAVPEP